SRAVKAVLIGSVTPYLMKTGDNPEGLEPTLFAEMAVSLRKDRFDFLKTFAPKFYGSTMIHHTVSEAVLDWTFSMSLTASLRSTLAAAQAWSATDFRREMTNIQIPVLVIHGSADSTVPLEASGKRSVSLLPNARLSVYDGEPHGLVITAADRLNAE